MRRLVVLSSFVLAVLVCSTGGTCPKPAPPATASCLPGSAATVLLDVKPNPWRHQLPLRLRLLGFSRNGRLALLEQREGEESEGGLWVMRVIDLEANNSILEEQLETEVNSTAAFCEAHGETLRQVLATNQIETSPLPKLAQFPLKNRGERFSLVLRRKAKTEEAVRPFEVWLYPKRGARQLGVVEQVYVESGRDPLGAPRVLGVLTSPFEPRVAVLIRQEQTATEAAVVPLVRVFGAEL